MFKLTYSQPQKGKKEKKKGKKLKIVLLSSHCKIQIVSCYALLCLIVPCWVCFLGGVVGGV